MPSSATGPHQTSRLHARRAATAPWSSPVGAGAGAYLSSPSTSTATRLGALFVDHVVAGAVVAPGVGYVEMACAAGPGSPRAVSSVSFLRPCVLARRAVRLRLDGRDDGSVAIVAVGHGGDAASDATLAVVRLEARGEDALPARRRRRRRRRFREAEKVGVARGVGAPALAEWAGLGRSRPLVFQGTLEAALRSETVPGPGRAGSGASRATGPVNVRRVANSITASFASPWHGASGARSRGARATVSSMP